ncbi:hypothetical protein Tco_0551683 [Tanacetum coccineum]
MHEDFEYVKSLEKEIDELESEKADFSNMYDLLLEEYQTPELRILTNSFLFIVDLDAQSTMTAISAIVVNFEEKFLDSALYTITLPRNNFSKLQSVYMATAQPTQAWVMASRLSQLNFRLHHLTPQKKDVVTGLPKLTYQGSTLTAAWSKRRNVLLFEASRTMLSSLYAFINHFGLKKQLSNAMLILRTDQSTYPLMERRHITSSMTGNLQ